ncbi:hypothetical protein QEH68_22395 (plasmid) [Paenarthrobacter sp. OM7]|uniref:hypothetical protein n=1 Tax=Paenarthrobacter sp. OM7 TaxID=3041264 RepID=UPI0024692479|nr:hypothetical protein [Paenarthrobacter sp. OM7]WGM22878.1 hypothetical protein QEH68_22395 [Paenarthrobacter sp. OM7]
MTPSDFYTDRLNGPGPRLHDKLPQATAGGLYSLFKTKAHAHWLAQHFPEHCDDGNGVCGTDLGALWSNVRALVPQLREETPYGLELTQEDGVVFDLIEYAAERVAKPVQGPWHPYMKHYELTFAETLGRTEFRKDVNQILQRGGTTYELNREGQIVRLATPEVQQVLDQLKPASGDTELDGLLSRSKELYLSRKADDRALALEKLWDAYERLKTVDIVGNKKQSADALLNNIASTEFRSIVTVEMKNLTDLGNQFMIRHHETDKHQVPEEAQDYLFVRMGSLIHYLLKVSNRLS